MRSFWQGFLTAWFWLSLVVAAAAAEVVIDDDPALVTAGQGSLEFIGWESNQYGSSWAYYGYSGDPEGSAELTYTFSVQQGTTYKIYGTWAQTSYNTTGGKLVWGSSSHEYVSTTPPTADKTLGGRPFQLLGEVTASSSSLSVKARSIPAYAFGADAIAIEEASGGGDPPSGTTPPANVTIFDYPGPGSFAHVPEPPAEGTAYGGGVVVLSSSNTFGQWHIDHNHGLTPGRYRLYISMPHGGPSGTTRLSMGISYPMAAAPGSQQAKTVNASYPVRATAGPEWGGANWELFADNINISDLIQYLTVQISPPSYPGYLQVDAIALERVGNATSGETTPGLQFEGATSSNMDDGTGDGGEPGGQDPEPFDPETDDPWETDSVDGLTDGEEYPSFFLPIDQSEQQLGAHVSVYWQNNGNSTQWGTGPEIDRPDEILAHVAGVEHLDRTKANRSILIGGRLKSGDAGAFIEVNWTVTVGRNGFVQVNFGPTLLNGSQNYQLLPRGETFIIAAIDYLLSDPEKLPVTAGDGGGMPIWRDFSDLHGERAEAITRNFLRALRGSLIAKKSWTGAIPRTPDESFDPGGGSGGSGGDLEGWPTDDAVPDESNEEDDDDGDGVPNYRDSAPDDSSIKSVKEHEQTSDKNFFSRWQPDFDALKDRLKNPFGDGDAPTLEEQYPTVYIPIARPNGAAAHLMPFTLQPDNTPLGQKINLARQAVRLICTLFLAVAILHRYVKTLQQW